jgi:hypothetical protein
MMVIGEVLGYAALQPNLPRATEGDRLFCQRRQPILQIRQTGEVQQGITQCF